MGAGSSVFGKRAAEMALGEKRLLTPVTPPPACKGPLMPDFHQLWGKRRQMRTPESLSAMILCVITCFICYVPSSSAGWYKNEFLNMTGVVAKAMHFSDCWICYALPSNAEQAILATLGLPLNEEEWVATTGRRISTGQEDPLSAAALHRYWAPLCVKKTSSTGNSSALGAYPRCIRILEEKNGSLTLVTRQSKNVTKLQCAYYLYEGNGSDPNRYLHFNVTIFYLGWGCSVNLRGLFFHDKVTAAILETTNYCFFVHWVAQTISMNNDEYLRMGSNYSLFFF